MATVDWRNVARDPARLERTRQTVADLVAVVTAARKRLADEDDEDALFLIEGQHERQASITSGTAKPSWT